MRFIKLFPLFSAVLLVLCFSCNEVNPKGEKEVRDFVIGWNETHTLLKSPYLERDYMDVVTYYGKERTKAQVQQDKNALFEQFPDYSQRILNDEVIITKEAVGYLVTFTKRVTYDGIEADYTSFLSVMYKNGIFKILREGVADTNKNLDAPIFPNTRNINFKGSRNREVFGDFNGDGLSDYVSVVSPKLNKTSKTDSRNKAEVQCEDGCNSVITFSSKDLEPITVEGAYQSQLENLKDLNGDGADEIGFWDVKPTTKSLYVFDATNGRLLCPPVTINTKIHKNLSLIDVFKKSGPNKITVSHSEEVNGKWILKSEIISLN
jgi:hypothetical protein